MFYVLVRALFRRTNPDELVAHTVERADIVTNRRSLRVALDGEVVRMRPPLTFRSRPGALRVLAPLDEPEVA